VGLGSLGNCFRWRMVDGRWWMVAGSQAPQDRVLTAADSCVYYTAPPTPPGD